jgi:peptide/nickel transport system substrate-binding protein
MRRSWRILALLAAFAIVVAACGDDDDVQPTTAPTDPPVATPAPTSPPDTMAPFEGKSVSNADGCAADGSGSIINSIEATDRYEVTFSLCKPTPAFRQIAAFGVFGIQPEEYITSTGGGGEQLLRNPVGTGPFSLNTWEAGSQVVLDRFEDYHGTQPVFDRLVVNWQAESAARLNALNAGTVDVIAKLGPDDFETVQNDANLQFLPGASPNIFYLGMTNTFPPFDDVNVRRAIAMGIDRQRIVDNFYPAGSSVATHFTPCNVPGGCAGDEWYEYDPATAVQMLRDAGVPEGFETAIYYRDVVRDYLPGPGFVAVEIQTQLRENLGIEAEVIEMESGAFIEESQAGRLEGFHMLGWTGDYPHVTNFLDFHFGPEVTQFGTSHPEITGPLGEGQPLTDIDEINEVYARANNAIKDLVPMVPIAWGGFAAAALASVDNAAAAVTLFGPPDFAAMDPGKDTLVYMQSAEPISLYCADESDGESFDVCLQVIEPLLGYDVFTGEVIPKLANDCVSNADLTVWTCDLKEGVVFHDGSTFDANDVVVSWQAGIDASSPLHVGNTGAWTYYTYLWNDLINKPAEDG